MFLRVLSCANVGAYGFANMTESQNESSTRYPCGVCADKVADFGVCAVACNSCDRWIHKSCVGMLTAEYEQLAETSLPWYCPDCGTAYHSSVLYDIPILDNSQHISYSSMSKDSVSPSTRSQSSLSFSNLSDTSLSSVGSPDAASSPKISNTSNGKARRSLRILVINFQSVRKKRKNIDVFVETTQPDIILGSET